MQTVFSFAEMSRVGAEPSDPIGANPTVMGSRMIYITNLPDNEDQFVCDTFARFGVISKCFRKPRADWPSLATVADQIRVSIESECEDGSILLNDISQAH